MSRKRSNSHSLIHSAMAFRAAAAMVCGVLLLAAGCGGDSATPSNATGPVGTACVLDSILLDWKSDPSPAQIDEIVGTDTGTLLDGSDESLFRMSEQEFVGLVVNRKRQTELQQQAIDKAGELKGLARACVARGEELADAGDREGAVRCFTFVRNLGATLQGADTLLIFQQMGTALLEMGHTALGELPEESPSDPAGT